MLIFFLQRISLSDVLGGRDYIWLPNPTRFQMTSCVRDKKVTQCFTVLNTDFQEIFELVLKPLTNVRHVLNTIVSEGVNVRSQYVNA